MIVRRSLSSKRILKIIRILGLMKGLTFILMLLPFLLWAQQEEKEIDKRLRKITQSSAKIPEQYTYSTYHLAHYLTTEAETNVEKVRSFYVWIANNVTYDMIGYNANNLPDYRPRAVLHNRLAVCEGYARLFQELCSEAGVRSEIVRGFAKGYGYEKGQQFGVSNHAWNVVYLDSTWQFIDVTWAARRWNDRETVFPLNDAYFLPPAQIFIRDHLPEIPAWQLLTNPVSKVEFESPVILLDSGDYNYSDTLELLLDKPQEDRTITYQLMARDFNSANDEANYKLGVEYRFRGLDILELIYKVEDIDTVIFQELEGRSFAAFNEAALYFTLIKPGSRYYESSQVFLDDTDFERGVFKYEVAHRMIELNNRFDHSDKKRFRQEVERLVLKNYEEAAIYFKLISRHSWYYEKAQEYLNEYLKNPFEPN